MNIEISYWGPYNPGVLSGTYFLRCAMFVFTATTLLVEQEGALLRQMTAPFVFTSVSLPGPPRQWRDQEVRVEDGCANLYAVWVDQPSGQEAFQYFPMTPMASSSGRYSGGQPVHHIGRMSSAQGSALRETVRACVADTAGQVAQRTMGTWCVTAGPGVHVVLKPDSEHVQALQSQLTDLKNLH